MKTKTFTAIVYQEDDMYVAECTEVGTVDQGATIEEAVANLKEATRLYLEECPLADEITPRFVTNIEVSYA
ncbi:MAG: type II toxin-antitoxin system HicB family antitoxin [Oscillatoria sp. SIO1A7]|nr:type II toxin-antitoxin system HicB family antitoxin [Oscillatoria sp. SIO1A7]